MYLIHPIHILLCGFFCQRELKIIKTNKPRNTSKLIISEGSSYFMASASETGEGVWLGRWWRVFGWRRAGGRWAAYSSEKNTLLGN